MFNKKVIAVCVAALFSFGSSFAEDNAPFKQVDETKPVVEQVKKAPAYNQMSEAPKVVKPEIKEVKGPIPPKSPNLSTYLPGVGSLPGAIPMNNNIRVRENATESVPVSMRYINRIATPFETPKVLEADGWEISKNGSSVFIKPNSANPAAIYITGEGKNDPTIGLVLVPQDIPPQTVSLQLDKTSKNKEAGGSSDDINKASSYSERIQMVMKSVALGKNISGYAQGPLPSAVSRSEHLIIKPEKRYSGRVDDVYVYWIENIHETEVELDESLFYEDGVRAIAFYPEIRLAPGQGTRLFIMSENGKGEK